MVRATVLTVCLAAAACLILACGGTAVIDSPGAGGATGTTTNGAGGQGGNGTVNVCACMKTALDERPPNDPCVACHIYSAVNGKPCADVHDACIAHEECLALVDCVDGCNDNGESDTHCLGHCMYPVDKSEGSQLYNDWVLCNCGQCVSECDSYGDLVCDPAVTGGAGSGGAGS